MKSYSIQKTKGKRYLFLIIGIIFEIGAFFALNECIFHKKSFLFGVVLIYVGLGLFLTTEALAKYTITGNNIEYRGFFFYKRVFSFSDIKKIEENKKNIIGFDKENKQLFTISKSDENVDRFLKKLKKNGK